MVDGQRIGTHWPWGPKGVQTRIANHREKQAGPVSGFFFIRGKMENELSFEEALRQWKDLQDLGWGTYWSPSKEPKWARLLTKSYANSWREVAFQRIAATVIKELQDKEVIKEDLT